MTREEAIERIKSYKRYLMGGNPIWSVEEVAKAFDMAIEALSAEAVDVVRCIECRHSRIEGDTTMFMWCGYWNKPTDGIRYCSDGERREP